MRKKIEKDKAEKEKRNEKKNQRNKKKVRKKFKSCGIFVVVLLFFSSSFFASRNFCFWQNEKKEENCFCIN